MKKILRFSLLTTILLFSIPFMSVAQGVDTTFSVHGNMLNTSNFLGSTNHKDLILKTNDTTRITISKDGDVNINNNLNVTGYVKADSIASTSGNINLNGNLNLPNNWIN